MRKVILSFFVMVLFFIFLVGCKVEKMESDKSSYTKIDKIEFRKMTCPNGIVHDYYPGMCSNYIDSNNNGECDLGE